MSGCRYVLIACLVTLAVGCTELKLPSEREMTAVFITEDTGAELLAPAVPKDVPIMAVVEMGDWSPICDECHVGPHYSSYTILQWGHRESCVSGIACYACHDKLLHQTSLRGNKAICYDCHMAEQLPITCGSCHTEVCRSEDTGHPNEFMGTHGQHADWQGLACDTCHGGKRWCLECHGLPMPHPENILAVHPDLVQGQAENCMNCHGRQACTNCHLANDVDVRFVLD